MAFLFSERLLAQATPPASPILIGVKNALLVSALIAFTLTLAGPRFGNEETTRQTLERDIFVLLDVSDSMLAEDVAPNRLTLAKLDVEDLLDAVVGDRVGLIAFAGSAQVEIPPTNDRTLFREMLQSIDVSTVALSGTAIGDALRLAVERLGDGSDGRERAIVLIADGEDHSSLPLEAALCAKSAGIPIYAIAIGDLEGAKIPKFDAAGRRVGYKIFDGVEALSKPDVETMREIAQISGGRFFHADAKFDMKAVYDAEIDKLNRSLRDETSRKSLKNRYRPFLAFGLLAFVLSRYIPTRVSRRSKRRSQRAAVFFLAVVGLVEIFNAVPISALETLDSPSQPQTVKNQDANVAQASPLPPPSATLDRDAVLKNRRSEIDAHNRSVEAARAGRLEEARALRAILVDAKTPEVAAKSRFNEAAETVRQIVANASPLDKIDAKSPNNVASEQEEDPLERYRREQSERVKSQRQEVADAENAARLFSDAASNDQISKRSELNAEATRCWLAERSDAWNKREVEERRRLLAKPNDRIRWLREEIRCRVKELESVEPNERDAAYYGDLTAFAPQIDAWQDDATEAAQAFAAQLESSGATSDRFNISDQDGAQKIRDALAEFNQRRQDAARQFAAFDGDAGAAELRRAETRLAAIQDVATPYPELALRLADDEEKLAAASSERFDADKPLNDGDFRQSRETLRAAVAETLRKARQIIVNPSFDAATLSNGGKNAEKILESALLAVENEKELNALIDTTQKLAQNDDVDASSLLDSEKRLVETLQKIARPLREENESPSNQQNKSDENQSQNNQNQQDNKQKQDSESNDDAKSNKNEDYEKSDSPNNTQPDDEANPEDSPPSENEKNQADDKNEESSESETSPEPSRQHDKSQRLKQTEAQKKADELTRRVRRRQQAAEAERRAVRNALRRRDSSGKDW
ncbi:MAG: VWA domain-containing protein [Thermoguttaceae bacterium]|nr:VWA domain-containing protein [Thermoguttaceae bacterium]